MGFELRPHVDFAELFVGRSKYVTRHAEVPKFIVAHEQKYSPLCLAAARANELVECNNNHDRRAQNSRREC